MSDLAIVTHDYEKLRSPFPALSCKWISQSLCAQAANGFSKYTSLATFEGSVVSESNLTLWVFLDSARLVYKLNNFPVKSP